MERPDERKNISLFPPMVFVCLLTMLVSALPKPAQGSFLYKNYVIKQDMGWEILCAPYIVQPNDWVSKIFKLRGEISQQDFPDFIRVFRRLNPHLKNIDRIRPGQQILIPLKRLRESPLPDNPTGIVTIPFVDLSRNTDRGFPPANTYKVKKGDTVSKLIAGPFGRFGSKSYREAITLFTQLNPHIKDLDLIFIDQTIFLPRSIALPGHRLPRAGVTGKVPSPPKPTNAPGRATSSGREPRPLLKPMIPPLAEAAAIMDARLLDKGKYYFPRDAKNDLELDMTRNPVLEMPDGSRVMLSGQKGLTPRELETVQSKWKDFTRVTVPAGARVEDILDRVLATTRRNELQPHLSFSAGGALINVRAKWIIKGTMTDLNPVRNICISFIEHPDQRTPTSIIRFLEHYGIRLKEVYRHSLSNKQAQNTRSMPVPLQNPVQTVSASGRRSFVNDLLNAMGYAYTQNVTITFPYAGTEIKALSNLVTTLEGKPVFVDYGDLFGDAFLTIQKTGFNIIQINHTDTPRRITAKLAGTLGPQWVHRPSFLAARRPAEFNTEFIIEGYLTDKSPGSGPILLTFTAIDRALVNMLKQRNIRIIVLPAYTG